LRRYTMGMIKLHVLGGANFESRRAVTRKAGEFRL
jgi:hypothetical protein